MGRIEEMHARIGKVTGSNLQAANEFMVHVIADMQYLTHRLQIAEEQLATVRDKAQILASHCAVQMDRGGNVGSSYAFEKSQEIYEMLEKLLLEEMEVK